jgi:hypothetical protein
VTRRLARWVAAAGVAAAAVGGAFLLMRQSSMWDVLVDARRNLAIYPVVPLDWIIDDPLRLVSRNWAGFGLVSYLTLPLVLVGAVGAYLMLRERTRFALVMLGAFAIPFATALTAGALGMPRYMLYVVPAFVVLTGYGLARLVDWAGRWTHTEAGRLGVFFGLFVLFLPALLFDARVLSNPETARYPGKDDEQYVSGWAAGTGWQELEAVLEPRLAARERSLIVTSTGFSFVFPLLVPGPGIEYVESQSPRRLNADFLIQSTPANFPDPVFEELARDRRFRMVWETHRPHDGVTLRLYERS